MADAFASVLIPQFRYFSNQLTIDGTNDEIQFRETAAGPDLLATVENGTFTYGEAAFKVKTALEAAGVSEYKVRFNLGTRLFTLTSDGSGGGGDFTLDVAGATNDLLPDIGFTVDKTGALTYTSDVAVPTTETTVTFTRRLKRPIVRLDATREDTILENARRESAGFGSQDLYAFAFENETPAVAQALYDLFKEIVQFGSVVEFHPDKDAVVDKHVDVVFEAQSWTLREMVQEGLYRHYAGQIDMQIAVPNTGDLDLRSLIDRRPAT